MSQAQLVEARTKAEVQRIEAAAAAEARRLEMETHSEAARRAAEIEAEVERIRTDSEVRRLREREQAAKAYQSHPALLRLQELETLKELARSSNARIYIGMDRNLPLDSRE
jgi:regulator of protease activity HflC (stomatin/prohibitin superfamily)